MNYTLNQLRIYQSVCKHQSVTKAAEDLHLTQPAVSIQLKKFQEQFEIPLTEVIGRNLQITNFGWEVSEIANKVLEQVGILDSLVNQYHGLLTGEIRFSVVSTGKYVMPYFLNAFAMENPMVQLRIDVTNKGKVLESLQQNTTDFALVSVLPEGIPVEPEALMENKLYLVAGKNFPLPDNFTAKDLEDLPLIFRENGSATRNAMERYLDSHGIRPSRKLVLVSNEAVKQAVNAGLGVSIMPIIGLRNELKLGSIRIVPLPDLPFITRWNLVYRSGKELLPAAKAFMEYIRKEKHQLAEQHFGWVE